VIACADMKNVYNHASRAIKWTDCALHQCVRVVPVPARMLKLGREQKAWSKIKETWTLWEDWMDCSCSDTKIKRQQNYSLQMHESLL